MKERVVTFGDQNNLVGILTEPDESSRNDKLPCVLILNSGMLHHVGPFRLHVVTARHLATKGFTVFRIDVGGIGDSLSQRGAQYDSDRVISDIRMAMDVVNQNKGISEYVLMGLCTGAANAHKVSVVDERVSGGVFLDGYVYTTWRFYINRYLPAILDPERGKSWLLRLLRRMSGVRYEAETETDADSEPSEDFGWWTLPPRNEVQKDLVNLVDRNVNLLYVYSGGQMDFYNYQKQFEHAFAAIDFKDRLKVIFNNEADHTYSIGLDRDRLLGQITDWLNDCYGS